MANGQVNLGLVFFPALGIREIRSGDFLLHFSTAQGASGHDCRRSQRVREKF